MIRHRTALLASFLIGLVSLTGLPAQAADPLLRDVSYQTEEDHVTLEIRLGVDARVTDFTAADGKLLKITLEPIGTDHDSQWSSAEMRFAEEDRALDTVAISGSGQRGYELTVSFSEPVGAQLLPQYDDRQVLIKLAPRREFKALARFGKVREQDPWTINLESRREGVPDIRDLPQAFSETHKVYITEFEQDGVLWQRLRLGFFPDQKAAIRASRRLKRYFPKAWVEQVSAGEVAFAEAFNINPAAQLARTAGAAVEVEAAPVPALEEPKVAIRLQTPESLAAEPEPEIAPRELEPRPRVEPPPPTELEELAEEARAAFELENYARAITLYTKLLAEAPEPDRQQALEMLGVSRELNRQLAHAKHQYETYLEEYPDTSGATRVQQRLDALLALDRPAPAQRQAARSRRQPESWRYQAQIAQFYQRHSLKVDDRASVPINGLFNDLNLSARHDGARLDQDIRVSASYLLDFTNNERLNGREFQVAAAYWEGYSERFKSGVRLGRQSRWDSGVLGRFDGAAVSYRPTPNIGLGLTGGYLIDSSFEAPDTNRPFFGISGEYLSDSGNLSVKPFFMQQSVDGVLDRQALGVQGQYYSERAVLFSLIDYDVHHKALNNLTVSGDFALGRSRIAASLEHRKSPYLTTRNALMGQPFEDLSELEEAILDLTLDELANDRTATSSTLRLGWNAKLSDRWTLSTDLVASDFKSTEASADVPGLESNKTLYTSFQLRSSELFGRGTYSALMLRHADSSTSATTSVYWDNRFSIGDRWRLYPRLRVDQRSFDRNGDTQLSLRPSLRIDFRLARRVRFELEGGYQWTTRDMANRSMDITGLMLRAGYRASF